MSKDTRIVITPVAAEEFGRFANGKGCT